MGVKILSRSKLAIAQASQNCSLSVFWSQGNIERNLIGGGVGSIFIAFLIKIDNF